MSEVISTNNDMNEEMKNYIIAEIEIKEEDINKYIRIINSFEESKRENKWEDEEDDYEYENEKEIKDNCEIEINNEKISFSYICKFKEKGKYIIKYSFKNKLNKTNYMFSRCESLTNINLSIFNTENVMDMGCMFEECKSLTNINLSNFNTQNVTDMSYMFYYCISLAKIDLSNFNTQNVIDMRYIFGSC